MIEELIDLSKILMDKLDSASHKNICVDMQIILERMSWEVLRMKTDLENSYERFGT